MLTSSTYTYDTNGLVLTKASIDEYGHSYRWTYTYDSGGKLTRRDRSNAAGRPIVTLSYRSVGDTIVEDTADPSGTTVWRRTFSYQSGRLTSLVENTGQGKVVSRSSWTYDGDGNLVSFDETNDAATVAAHTAYARGFKGDPWADPRSTMWIESYRDPGGVTYTYRFTYDGQQRPLIRETLNSQGQVQGRWAATYDANGNLLTLVQTDAEHTGRWSYTYDGNKTKTAKQWADASGLVLTRWAYVYVPTTRVQRDTETYITSGVVNASTETTDDDAMKWISIVDTDVWGYSISATPQYNSSSKITRKEWKDPDGVTTNWWTFTYGSDGKLTREDDHEAGARNHRPPSGNPFGTVEVDHRR
jgi:hypothetical protein